MLNKLSATYQKEIALTLINIFIIGGLASFKIQACTGLNEGKQQRIIHVTSSSKLFFSGNSGYLLPQNKSLPVVLPEKAFVIKENVVSEKKRREAPPIGGPGQPEMSSFKPVGSDNMVSPFTGDFSYNIPLLDVGGYPVNMFYNSGITMDQEASWVGLGWNINPGAINRNMRGLPDDFNGEDTIIKRQSIRPDKTWGVTADLGLKFGGNPIISSSLGINFGLSFNNKLGVAAEAGIHPALNLSSKKTDEMTSGLSYGASAGVALNLSSRSGASMTPSISFSSTRHDGTYGTTASIGSGYTYSSRLGLEGMHLNAGLSMSKRNSKEVINNKTKESETKYYNSSASIGTLNSGISFVYPTIVPSVQNIYTRKSYTLSFGVGMELWALNPHAQLLGFYSESTIAEQDRTTYHKAYGFLYYQEGNNDAKAMLDFNRVNEGVYTPNSPAIPLPVYTYDIFSITGEGTGGSFRAYRGDIGFMRDAEVQTRDDAFKLGVDVGVGNVIHGGAELSAAFSPNKVAAWKINNTAAGSLGFKNNDSTFQAVYFKNPGEKAIPDMDFQEAIGGENLVRFKMANVASGTPLLLPALLQYDGARNQIGEKQLSANNVTKVKRDKRTQIITFLTGEEAAHVGFNRRIYSYETDNPEEAANRILFSDDCHKAGIDSFKRTNLLNSGSSSQPDASTVDAYRKPHHISEINVLGTDGRKYVYGLPVYNTKQVSVSFSVNNIDGDTLTGKSDYKRGIDDYVGTDEEQGNKKGRDWYVQQEETPAYTHSFLLTELVSPNYVDVTGNGISEDDMGDAVKFNYTKYNKGFQWRTPSDDKANYSEGLKTDPNDDKAHYVYGEREMWLLYSVESKNMIARFYVKNDRKDGKQVLGQAGGIDVNWGMQRLDKICLYSKGDLVKNPSKAKPIKTIRFFQSYKLCVGTDNSLAGYGKLTLDSIWITYNGNDKKPKSRFIFSYPEENNPTYDFVSNDGWGTYKPATDNPGKSLNADYPYSVQEKAKADKYAAAWTMNKIILPSGGIININYESDDYAYVQNKKAATFQQIIGFGTSANPDLTASSINQLYVNVRVEGKMTHPENDYVYIKLPYAINQATPEKMYRELTARYFAESSQLFMKLAVTMPSGKNIPGLKGNENIPVYADIASFGLIDSGQGRSSTVAWVKVERVENGMTPMTQQALQFLKQQLPGKAYQGYDLSEQSGIKSVLLALGGMVASFKGLGVGEDRVLMDEGKSRFVFLSRSFARLTNPYMQKTGGGLRVKKVIINDNWNKMSGQYESTYGQEYRYTTKELINNNLCTISSGVAAWEPSIAGDENPHSSIMRFQNHNKGGPYDFGAIMMPLGEAFYPSPMVGYSRIEVLSIHRDTVKNLPTRQVKEFYTTKDFPFKSDYTSLLDKGAKSKREPRPILKLLKLDMVKAITLSQGFLVDMNDMNGKERKQSIYAAFDSVNPVSSTENFYNVKLATNSTYSFNHSFPTIESAEGKVGSSIIGRDIELMADFREHTSETITANISPNFDFFFAGIFPVPITNVLQPVVNEKLTYRSASLLKIVNHYGVLDSVVVIDKGSMVSTKNLVYDAETGNPLLTRTNNEHNRPVYNFTYPAHWAYSGMGQAYKNIDATYRHVNFSHGKLISLGGNDVDNFLNTVVESGDEFYALSKTGGPIDKEGKCDDLAGTDAWTTLAQSSQRKIWAVNTGKASQKNPQWIFIDKDGNPFNSKDATIRLVRSGRRNLLDQNVGSVTSLDYPVKNNGKLKFNEATNIIQTAAATFKDHWRVDNSFYVVDSVVQVKVPVTVRKLSLVPETNLSVLLYHCYNNGRGNFANGIFNQAYFIAEARSLGGPNNRGKHYLTSFAKYHINTLPADATIISAKLSLNAHHDGMEAPNKMLRHTFPSINCDNQSVSDHRNFESHDNEQKNGWNNAFKFTRMTRDWNNINTSGLWRDYVVNQAYNGIEGSVGHEPTTYPPYNSFQSYISLSSGESGCRDERIDVSAMVKKMSLERDKPSIIKMELIKNNSYKLNRNDFYAIGGTEDRPVRVCFEPPTLDIYYYTCSDNNNVTSGNSVSPNVSTPSCDPNFPPFECVTSQHRLFCFSKFTEKKSINPYTEGILGNWRIDTTFAYYGDRKESNPKEEVDIRTAGTIANYKDFWNLGNQPQKFLSRNMAANDVWVWNSTITQYNRKGYEIENKDPLGRFNAGLYGYHQQLPIAVVNNSRVREALFDGFEDYDYKSSPNCLTCKPPRSFNYDGNILDYLDSTQHHTGLKSLRLKARQSLSVVAPITDTGSADKDFGLRMRVDSMRYKDTVVTGKGSGLQGVYDQPRYTTGSWPNKENHPKHNFTRIDNTLNFQWGEGSPGHGIGQGPGQDMEPDHFTVVWTGKIQPRYSELYTFTSASDDEITVKINNVTLFSATSPKLSSGSVFLTAGNTYNLSVLYKEHTYNAYTDLYWQSKHQPYEIVPKLQLYPPGQYGAANGTVTITTSPWCTRLDSVNVSGNALTDSFSLLQNKKMLVSAWVKEGGNDCKCSTYTRNNLLVSYAGSSDKLSLKPSGSIIEGWQRYEEVFTVPASATEIKITLTNTSDQDTVYFDDLRIHPYNANMKSFVYHASNLRLTSELDENNYATFYEYDDDGTLTRVKKETERGIKTITETRSGLINDQ